MLKNVLRIARNNKSLKQEDVANAIEVTKQTYLKWENGSTEPKASQIQKLSKVLGITPNEICQGVLYIRYPLDKFIMELHKSHVRPEMEVLKSWMHIQNHKGYIDELNTFDENDIEISEETAEFMDHNAMEEAENQRNDS